MNAYKPDRFRRLFRSLDPYEKKASDEIKETADTLANVIENAAQAGVLKDPRYEALALTALEESVMWAIKGITAESVSDDDL